MPTPTIHAANAEQRPIEELLPYLRNSRKHTQETTAALVRGLQEFGWTYPVLIDEDGGILAGHGRVLAAQKLKMTSVPVIVAKGWSEDQKRAYIIWDNKSSDLTMFDPDVLRLEMGALQGTGFDLSLTGFSSLELNGLFAVVGGNVDPDDAPEVPKSAVSASGDTWRLGEHVLTVGDCTDPAVMERALDGARPHLLVTDQPFGVEYDPAFRSKAFGDGAKRAEGAVRNDHRADWRETWALFQGDVIYVWHDPLTSSTVQAGLEAAGFELRSQIIWNKSRFAVGRGHYHWKHEAMFYAVRKGKSGHWAGDRKQSTVWDIDAPKRSETGHSTQKPVECMKRPLENNSTPNTHVLDPFSGSGTLMIAAQMTKRIAHCIEIEPLYADLICLRFAAFTGTAPTLDETGETFEQVKARRAAAEDVV